MFASVHESITARGLWHVFFKGQQNNLVHILNKGGLSKASQNRGRPSKSKMTFDQFREEIFQL